MSIYALKPAFQRLLRPAVVTLQRAGVTANQVTLATCAGSLAVGALLVATAPSTAAFALLPAWLFLRMALNAADGMLAREFGQASPLGAYLNELCDVVADTALYLPFAWVPGSPPWLVVALVLLAALTELAGVLGETVGGGRRYDGPMGKSDRAFVFGTLGLLLAAGVPLAGVLPWLWGVLGLLLAWTVVNRVRGGLRAAARA
ncbi:MAG TPA: CDP-alcohol phosphatidyltransferase family protein [Gammaproteobacteria bacterium]